ncbi:MAG: hypothetical protein ACOYZ6_17345 [Chloroflexota bacterium]
MKNPKQLKALLKVLLVMVFISLAFGLYSQARAQQEIVNYLNERLKQQNVPVVDIDKPQRFPLHIQISIQSASDGDKATPNDPINLGLTRREVILAGRRGYLVERFTIILLNSQGKLMGKVDHSASLDDIFIDTSPSKLKDSATISLVANKMNFYGMSAKNMEIASSEGLQVVTIQLATSSIDEANQALPRFMPSLRPSLEEINDEGAHIVMVKLELKDTSGNILLNYLLDLQLRFENWWMADGVTADWFPHPAPAP